MNAHLQIIAGLLGKTEPLSEDDKDMMFKALREADKEITISAFKLERTEKVKRTTTILLEETIEELEQKRMVVEESKAALEITLADLKAAQNQLIQQEKLASLGQLTAGIAHEIKNPLNFVNNFSEVSLEMIDEALEELGKADSSDHTDETALILADIKSNLTKIHSHGSRADSIVKAMLQHSRGGSGTTEPTDLNALIREHINLSYHGMRAGKDPLEVNIDLQLDESIGEIPLIAEDFSRIILNLSTNAFDAMKDKMQTLTPLSLPQPQAGSSGNLPQPQAGSFESLPQSGSPRRVPAPDPAKVPPPYTPKLTIRTHKTGGTITIEFEDNGPGIPDGIKDKILQPFFTTKKGTQGTGLGLSITHDIIKAHGGTLHIESSSNGTIMKVTLSESTLIHSENGI
ncbi:MAG: sensor histidine kinase [Cyclonatronaceae bacterium]